MENKLFKRLMLLALVYLTALGSSFMCGVVSNDPSIIEFYERYQAWFLVILGIIVTLGLVLSVATELPKFGFFSPSKGMGTNSKGNKIFLFSVVIGVTSCFVLTWWSVLYAIFR